jgi:arylsulfatase A-like enzyme
MPAGKPNILVIWGDDIGITNLSCYSDGLMGYRTRNIDRIASEGMRFTDSYGEQSCTAGRAAFISGQSVYRTGMSKGVPGSSIGWAAEDVNGFDEFCGNLHHLNAEEEPESPGYPHEDPFPRLNDFALPRGVLKCRATDGVSTEPDDPKYGRVGNQIIHTKPDNDHDRNVGTVLDVLGPIFANTRTSRRTRTTNASYATTTSWSI